MLVPRIVMSVRRTRVGRRMRVLVPRVVMRVMMSVRPVPMAFMARMGFGLVGVVSVSVVVPAMVFIDMFVVGDTFSIVMVMTEAFVQPDVQAGPELEANEPQQARQCGSDSSPMALRTRHGCAPSFYPVSIAENRCRVSLNRLWPRVAYRVCVES